MVEGIEQTFIYIIQIEVTAGSQCDLITLNVP